MKGTVSSFGCIFLICIFIFTLVTICINHVNALTSSQINNADVDDYQSSEAKTLIQKAQNEWDLSTSYANQGKYQDAIACINRADDFTQVDAKELAITTYRDVYLNLYQEKGTRLATINADSFQSPEAKSLAQEAQTAFNLATSLANQGKYQEAISNMNEAYSKIEAAVAKEQIYHDQQKQQPQFLRVAAFAVVLTIVIAVLLWRVNMAKKKPGMIVS